MSKEPVLGAARTSRSHTRRVQRVLGRFALAYFVFGVAHVIVDVAYCGYRAASGNPSDLPCLSPLWTPMDLLGWPLMAYGDSVSGTAVLLPPILVRTSGFLFLGGFVVALAWVFRGPGSKN